MGRGRNESPSRLLFHRRLMGKDDDALLRHS